MNSTPGPDGSDPFGDAVFGGGGPAGLTTPVPGVGGYQAGYVASPYAPYSRYAPPFTGSYAGYGSGIYGSGGGLYSPHGGGYTTGIGRASAVLGGAQHAQAGGAAVLSGMQEAMQRFARVSGLMEEVLHNLHVLFDGVFGLGYSIGAFHDEARLWLSVKTGPAGILRRIYLKCRRLWRLITLFLCSPFAGEFSPLSLVLRLLGVAPAESLPDVDLFLAQYPSANTAFSSVSLENARGGHEYTLQNTRREPRLFRSDSSM
jgi:hypothetical protein